MKKKRQPTVIRYTTDDGITMTYTAKELRLAGFNPVDIWFLRYMARADQAEERARTLRERTIARRRKQIRLVVDNAHAK